MSHFNEGEDIGIARLCKYSLFTDPTIYTHLFFRSGLDLIGSGAGYRGQLGGDGVKSLFFLRRCFFWARR